MKNKETGFYTVFEGNTRLAAIRLIVKSGNKTNVPTEIDCRILADDTPQEVINAIVGQAHLDGKKEWESFEANSYLVREFEYRQSLGHPLQEIYKDLKDEFGVPPGKIKNAVSTFSFIKENNMEDTHWAVDKYSHFEEYIKSAKIRALREIANDPELAKEVGLSSEKNALDKEFVRQVKQTDQIAYELRKALVSISDAASLKNYSPLKSILEERNEILNAVNLVEQDAIDVVTVIEGFSKS